MQKTHPPEPLDGDASNADKVVLVSEKITKRFPGTVALDQVDFTAAACIGQAQCFSRLEQQPDKCVLFHCGNWAKSFFGEVKMANAEILARRLEQTILTA